MSAPAKVKPAEEAASDIQSDLTYVAERELIDGIRHMGFRRGEFEQEDSDDPHGPIIVRRVEDGARFEVEIEVSVHVLPPEERTHMGAVRLSGRVFRAGGTEDAPVDLTDVLDRDGVPWEYDPSVGEWRTFGGITDTWQSLRDRWGPLSEMDDS